MPVATRRADVSRGYFVGSYVGTTAAQTIEVGFQPAFLLLVNYTDNDEVFIWAEGMTNNRGVRILGGSGAFAKTTNAITPTSSGFSLVASDAEVNENGKTYFFLALPKD